MRELIKSKKLWVAFLTVFVSGIAIGVVVGKITSGPKRPCGAEQGGPGFLRNRMFGSVRQLNLTEEQKVAVDKILIKLTQDVKSVQMEHMPKIREIINSAFTKIEGLLNEEQIKAFRDRRKFLSCHMGKGMGRPGRGMSGGGKGKYGHGKHMRGAGGKCGNMNSDASSNVLPEKSSVPPTENEN